MKISSPKNKDTPVSIEDERFLIHIYPVDQLFDFRLEAQPRALRRVGVWRGRKEEQKEIAPKGDVGDRSPASDNLLQHIIGRVHTIFEKQQ